MYVLISKELVEFNFYYYSRTSILNLFCKCISRTIDQFDLGNCNLN